MLKISKDFHTKHYLSVLLLITIGVIGCQRDTETQCIDPSSGINTEAAQRIQSDVRTLSGALFSGRKTATSGYMRAAKYVANRYRDLGLQPVGDDGSYLQRIALLKSTPKQIGARLEIHHHGTHTKLDFIKQFIPIAGFSSSLETVIAPSVFVAQGIDTHGIHSFYGLNLKNKIAVLFNGAPNNLNGVDRNFHAQRQQKLAALAKHGAIGAILIENPQNDWSRHARTWKQPAYRLRDQHGNGIDAVSQLRTVVSVSAAAAELLFAGAPKSAAQAFADIHSGDNTGFALPATITLSTHQHIEWLQSDNVIAMLPGQDVNTTTQCIVYSAHLDHLGQTGDTIFHGALDNALGVAIMLEAARQHSLNKQAGNRSLLFAATTAEEQGLLGAHWLALHPPAQCSHLIANINIDMPVLLRPTKDIAVVGIGQSSLLDTVLGIAANTMDAPLSKNPFSKHHLLTRSDQYAFIHTGIPGIYLTSGILPVDPIHEQQTVLQRFLDTCYHHPCDHSSQPIVYEDAARMAHFATLVGQLISNAPTHPTWDRVTPLSVWLRNHFQPYNDKPSNRVRPLEIPQQ